MSCYRAHYRLNNSVLLKDQIAPNDQKNPHDSVLEVAIERMKNPTLTGSVSDGNNPLLPKQG